MAKDFEIHNRVDPWCHKNIAKQYWFYLAFENSICKDYITGYSLLVAIILASIKPEYDDRLFIELRVHYKKTASSAHTTYTRNNMGQKYTQPDGTLFFLIFSNLRGRSH